jgi:predicted component of type VI protein secretion system
LSTYGDTLSRELASMLHEHAQEQHYMFAGPVSMNFTRSDDLTTGRFRVRSEASAAVTPPPGAPNMSDTMVSRAPLFLEINGTKHPLEAPGLTIGRGTQADLRIDDPGVSRRHVEFRVQPGTGAPSVSVVDLGSTNGTTVNGQRIQHAALENGSVVQIGSTRIIVHVGGSQPRGPQQRPAPSTPASAGPGQDSPYPPYRPQTAPPPPPPGGPGNQPRQPDQAGPAGQGRSSRRSRRDKHQPPFKVADQPPSPPSPPRQQQQQAQQPQQAPPPQSSQRPWNG